MEDYNAASVILSAVIGGSGIVGLGFAYIRRAVDKKLKEHEAEETRRRAVRLHRLMVEDEWNHAAGRLFFFVHKAIVTGHHNGDLEAAFSDFQDAEVKKKELDRRILVESELDM